MSNNGNIDYGYGNPGMSGFGNIAMPPGSILTGATPPFGPGITAGPSLDTSTLSEDTTSQTSETSQKRNKGKKEKQGTSGSDSANLTGPHQYSGPTFTVDDLKNLKIHLSQPMPIAGTLNAPIFNGIDVSNYFRILDRYFTAYIVTNNQVKKE
jgi:hypothetical protein